MTQPVVTKRAEEWLTEEGLAKLTEWAYAGLIYDDIAHNMGITRMTLGNWRAKYPEIDVAIDAGKAPADLRVESALFRRALGYDHTEKTYEMFPVVDENGIPTGKMRRVLTKEVEKHLPGDVKAMMNWLKNRMPDRWKDGQFTVEVNTHNPFQELTSEELLKIASGEYDE